DAPAALASEDGRSDDRSRSVEVSRNAPVELLVAGHDLKFIEPTLEHFDPSAVRITRDLWESHDTHNEVESREKLAGADVVLCEWGLGNAVWYADNVRSDQRLVVRVHAQEVR